MQIYSAGDVFSEGQELVFDELLPLMFFCHQGLREQF